MTIEEIKKLREKEDKVEFKEAQTQYNYNNGRRSVIGYVVALANEGGGKLILGVKENKTGLHQITGSSAWAGQEGKLKENIYRDKQVRVETEVLYEGVNRVLVIHIPSHPVGKVFKFEDVPLMRVGEDLLPMSDEQFLKIIQEQEPDFSAKICRGLNIGGLDAKAIETLKVKYAAKQNNKSFLTLPNEQVLSDLDLMKDGKLTYAALILLGTKKTIKEKLPQAKTILEFRNTEPQISHDWREEVDEPLFIGIDKIWNYIDSRNSKIPIRSGPYIFDIPAFNEDVIREAVLNAIAHRDYSLTGETLIKIFPKKITINNPGGFPKGVTLENILTVNSTPRSRLLTDVLLKTGLVERSGQGVDKIFSLTLSEGKAEPDYSASDYFQVSLVLSADVIDMAFYAFINELQDDSSSDVNLGVHEIITLAKIRNGFFANLNPEIVRQLEKDGLIKRHSGSHSNKYILGEPYQSLIKQPANIGPYVTSEVKNLVDVFDNADNVKIGAIVSAFDGVLSRDQVRYLVERLIADEIIDSEGKGFGTMYHIAKRFTGKARRWERIESYLKSKYS